MCYYTANANRMKFGQNGFKMMQYILKNDGATKYECLTEALGKKGSKHRLRGYYSCYFRGWMDAGVVTYDPKTYKYHATAHGAHQYLLATLAASTNA